MDSGSQSDLSGPSTKNESLWSQQQQWIQEQELLKSRLILHDDFPWTLPGRASQGYEASNTMSNYEVEGGERLQYIGGVDLSFPKDDFSYALGALVVLEMDSLKVVYEDFDIVELEMPYIPGFLAFRESPVLLNLLNKMALKEKALFPQLLMVDGNGILHPRGFGLASQLGVLADIPTIGVAKNLHLVDGLSDKDVRLQASKSNVTAGDTVPLIGKSGQVWGAADIRSRERLRLVKHSPGGNTT